MYKRRKFRSKKRYGKRRKSKTKKYNKYRVSRGGLRL